MKLKYRIKTFYEYEILDEDNKVIDFSMPIFESKGTASGLARERIKTLLSEVRSAFFKSKKRWC